MAQHSAKTELLAPAGSTEGIRLAVGAGADAVYFGVGDFHARRAAKSIDLTEAVKYCHLFGVKAYLTLNIMVKDAETERVADLIEEAYRAKIDAFIVTDLGILSLLNRYAPGVKLHASTQLGVAAKEGAELLKELGFCRVVMAREAGLKEIQAVKSTGIEVEYFVHGAVCVAFSGACLMSSIKSGDSGNRGLCKQPCRLSYRLKMKERETSEEYFLSTKDQCLLRHLTELREAGVDSFKIEGRLKRDVYAGGVAAIYRSILDGKPVENFDFDVLKRLFQRGDFSEGYTFNQNRSMLYPDFQGHLGVKVGTIASIEHGYAQFECFEKLEPADGFKVMRRGGEAKNAKIGALTSRGDSQYAFCAEGVNVGDEIRLTNDASLDRKISKNIKKIPVLMHVELLAGKPALIEARYKEIVVNAVGEVAEAARSESLTENDIRTAVEKSGGTEFEVKRTEVVTDGVFYRKSALNELRRTVIASLKSEIIKSNTPEYENRNEFCAVESWKNHGETERGNFANATGADLSDREREVCDCESTEEAHEARSATGVGSGDGKRRSNRITEGAGQIGNAVFAEVDGLEKAFAVPDDGRAVIVYRPTRYDVTEAKAFYRAFRAGRKTQLLLIFTPPMMLEADTKTLRETLEIFDGAVANSLSAVKIARDQGKLCVGGVNLNIANRGNPLIALCDAFCLSVELNERERFGGRGAAVYAFGRLPLMYLKHCPKKTAGASCKNCNKKDKIELVDGAYRFPIERFESDGECRFRLLNSVNTDLGTTVGTYCPYLDFGSVSASETAGIYREYAEGIRMSRGNYTLLHAKRGVK